jgi:serine/threonine-protein kinase
VADVVIRLQRYFWTLGELLGGGGFGRVFIASCAEVDSPTVAKMIPKAPGAERELLFEDLEGARNVVPIIDSGETDDNYILVMPRADESLRAHLAERHQLPEADAVAILRDISAALEDLDGKVVHRDLKPDNVLYLNGFWSLADFGISRYAEATTAADTRKFSMTPPYAAPEQWRGERATARTDIYALGIMASEMLAGGWPFTGPDFRHQHLHETPPALEGASGPLAALVAHCLQKDSGSRPTAAEVSRQLAGLGAPPPRAGLGRLQQAHHAAVIQQGEIDRQASVAQSQSERQAQLFEDAQRSLTAISEELRAALTDAAPSIKSKTAAGDLLVLELGEARLRFGAAQQVQVAQAAISLPFTVTAFAEMSLIAPGSHGYRGRAHSLWYCDLEEEDRFAWYETGFMDSPFGGSMSAVAPYSKSPAAAAIAFARVTGAQPQLAWTPTRIVPGQLDEFIIRWGDWLADAHGGRWAHPSQLPEHQVLRNWRGA